MTPEEAAEHVASIRQVIARSRSERARSGDIYLVWGLVVIVADLFTVLGVGFGYPLAWIAFPILTPFAAIYAGVVSARRGRQVSTFGGRVEARMWILTTPALTGMMFAGFATGAFQVQAIVPVTSAVLGICVGTSGVLFASRAMTAAGWMFLAVSVGTFFVSLPVQHLIFCGAMALGYLLPGFLLLRQERAERPVGPTRTDA